MRAHSGGDACRPGVEIGEPRDDALGRVHEVEAAAAQVRGQLLRVGGDPEDGRPLLARRVEQRLVGLDRGHRRAVVGELCARLARSAVQVQDVLARQVAERLLDDRRQGGAALAVSAVDLVEHPPVDVGRLHLRPGGRSRRRRRASVRTPSRASSEQRNETARGDVLRLDEPAGRRAVDGGEHLVLVREVLERAGLDDAGGDGVDADAARRELDGEVAHDRLERRLRRPDEDVVLEDALRAEARDGDDRRPALHRRRRRAREREQRACVRVHRPVPVLVVGLERGPDDARRRVVDDDAVRAGGGDLLDDLSRWRRCRARGRPRRRRRGSPRPQPRRPRRCAGSRARRASRRRARAGARSRARSPAFPRSRGPRSPGGSSPARQRLVGRRGARQLRPAGPGARLAPPSSAFDDACPSRSSSVHLLLGVAADGVVVGEIPRRAPRSGRAAGTRNAASQARRGRRCRRGSARPRTRTLTNVSVAAMRRVDPRGRDAARDGPPLGAERHRHALRPHARLVAARVRGRSAISSPRRSSGRSRTTGSARSGSPGAT